jgi:branched-chain amino acid transport system permease protein
VNTLKYKVQAFCIGAFMVGLAGSIFAHYIRYISPLDFTWRLGLDFIAYNVVGGITQLLGPTLGTVILMPLPEVLRGAAEYQWIMYSLVIILMLRFMPEGLASIRLRRLKTRATIEETPR